ncbi:MAG TPA: hemolysin III family protein [Candidatus Thermoplasmatota archaeon]|nr:hemolysin III family protein [Candidatus Thermoplasmatota archaeon]
MGIKEPFNSISHMVGGGLALALLPLLVARAHGPLAVTAVCVYGGSLVVMYALSSLYHSIPHRGAEPWLFRLDQVGIYLLIAGTYTPVALVRIGGASGWTLFAIEWGLALVGITLCLAVHRTPQLVHQVAYVALGWAAVTALPGLLKIPILGLALLLGGGLLYTGGSVLYNRNRPQTIGPLGDHEVWHLLVLGGSIAHAAFVVVYVLL